MILGLAALCHLYYGSTSTNTAIEDALSPQGSLWTLFIANENISVLNINESSALWRCINLEIGMQLFVDGREPLYIE